MLFYNNDIHGENETSKIKVSIDGELNGFNVYDMVGYIIKYKDFNNTIDMEEEYKKLQKTINQFKNITITIELQQQNKTLESIRYVKRWETWERSFYNTDQNGFYEWDELKRHDIKKQLNKLYEKLMYIHNETMVELLKEIA